MRKIALIIAATAFLAGCGGGDNQMTKDAVAQLIKVGVKSGCTVEPSLTDIGVALSSQFGPAGTIAASAGKSLVDSYVKDICDQWKAKKSISAAVDDGCIATVNKVCIHKEK